MHDWLRSIAQQFHSGIPVIDMDFGGAQLQQMDKLHQVYLALRKYPTPDSAAVASNAVVSAEPPGTPQNIRQLLVHQQSPTAVPPSKLKVHWKLKITAWRQKQRLYLDLRWIEESLQNAYGDFGGGVGEWQSVERLYLEYGEAIKRANAFIVAVYDDQERYYWNSSRAWQASYKAWAYREWMENWEQRISNFDLPNRNGGDELVLNAGAKFRAFPDAPTIW